MPRRGDATAFFEAGRSLDIVDWLVCYPKERETIESMAQQVGDACEGLLTKKSDAAPRLADHFWCDVLAALIHVLTQALDEADKLSGTDSRITAEMMASRTWEAVRAQRTEAKGIVPCQRKKSRGAPSRAARDVAEGLHDEILAEVVRGLVTALVSGVVVATHAALDPLLLRLRILAILMCPDPYAHKAVWNYCVVPLLKQGIVIPAGRYLEQFYGMFRQRWTWPT